MEDVLLPRLPKNAICYLGITLGDLYPRQEWNFVFGQGSLDRRVGVYSLARYFAGFSGGKETAASRKLALLRSCKVLAHETGHMFSLEHCVYFLCVMNGSNSLGESDRQPLHLGPVCASKLTWNRTFTPAVRYARLARFYQ